MTGESKAWTREEIVAAEDTLIDFQFAVIDAMNAQGLNNARLAEMLGVSRSRVSQMLASDANPTIKLVARTLHLLGLSCDFAGKKQADQQVHGEPVFVNREEIDAGRFALVMSRNRLGAKRAWHQSRNGCANINTREPRKAA